MSYMKASLMERTFEVGIHQTAAAIALADRVIGERNELLRTLREIASLPERKEHLAPGLAYLAIEKYEGETA